VTDPTGPPAGDRPAGGSPDRLPASAARLAELLGDRLPRIESVPAEDFALVEAVRGLLDALVVTAAGPAVRAGVAATVGELTATLAAVPRDTPFVLVRHANGAVEHLTQAGSGRLNPRAPKVRFEGVVTPPPGSAPTPVEILGHCTLGPSHAGSTGRAHGGVVATLLDEVLGTAALAGGAAGLTRRLEIDYRAPTPVGTELVLRGRLDRVEGRKIWARGEVVADGVVTAEAVGLFIGERR